MIFFERAIYSAPVGCLTFRNVFERLDLPPLRWLVTDLYMTTRRGSGVNALAWEQRVLESSDPGLWISHAEMLDLVRGIEQLIDGEFLGYESAPGRDRSGGGAPVVRIDFFDSATVTVVVNETACDRTVDLETLLGPGRAVRSMRTRADGSGTAR
jgi:hypothetical protein